MKKASSSSQNGSLQKKNSKNQKSTHCNEAAASSKVNSKSASAPVGMGFDDLLKTFASDEIIASSSSSSSGIEKNQKSISSSQNQKPKKQQKSVKPPPPPPAKPVAPITAALAKVAATAPSSIFNRKPSTAPVSTKPADHDDEEEDDEDSEDYDEDDDDEEDDDQEDDDEDEDEDNNDDDEEDDEDEEEEEEELTFEGHRLALEKLKDQDPAFYASLVRDAPGLLEFGEGEDEDERSSDDDEEKDDEEKGSGKGAKQVATTKSKAAAMSFKKAAATLDEEDDGGTDEEEEEEEVGMGRKSLKQKQKTLAIEEANTVLDGAFKTMNWRSLCQAVHAFRGACYTGDAPDVLNQLGLLDDDGNEGRQGSSGDYDGDDDHHDGGAGGRKKLKALKNATGKDAKGKAKAAVASEAAKVAAARVKSLVYRVATPQVFILVVTEVLRHAGSALAHHMGKPPGGGKQSSSTTTTSTATKAQEEDAEPSSYLIENIPLTDYPGHAKVAPLSRALLAGCIHLLVQSKEASMLTFLLRSMGALLPYLQGSGFGEGTRIRKTLKAILTLLGSHDSPAVRIAAYIRLRQAATILPYPAIDLCLKGAYMAYVRNAKFMNETGASNIALSAVCVTELYGVDETASYQHAFTYLRQLAIYLRTALTTHSKEAVSNVLSWQFVNCLRLWTQVLCQHGTDTSRPLFQLVYPLVSIIQGTIRLQSAPRYFPLRLHAAAMLNDLAWATGVYIPVAPVLLDILRSPTLASKPKGAAASNPPLLNLMVKVGKTTGDTRAYHDVLITRTFELLADSLRVNYCSIAFPEVVAPTVTALRHFAKATRVAAWRARAKALSGAAVAQSTLIVGKRSALAISPGDRVAVAQFMHAEATALRNERTQSRGSGGGGVTTSSSSSSTTTTTTTTSNNNSNSFASAGNAAAQAAKAASIAAASRLLGKVQQYHSGVGDLVGAGGGGGGKHPEEEEEEDDDEEEEEDVKGGKRQREVAKLAEKQSKKSKKQQHSSVAIAGSAPRGRPSHREAADEVEDIGLSD